MQVWYYRKLAAGSFWCSSWEFFLDIFLSCLQVLARSLDPSIFEYWLKPMLLDHGMWHLSYNMNDMMLYGGIHLQSTDWIHSFIACDLYCAAEATHQGPNGSFPSPRQQGTWCCLHIPLCEEGQRWQIRGYLQGELEEEEVHTCHAICINESFTTCYTHLISPIDIAVDNHECRELLLVDSCNLHCAMVINLVQLNAWLVEETNI